MPHAPHIVILCSRLDLPGGIERVVVNTANLFHKKGWKATLLILDDTPETVYTIEPGVDLIQYTLSFGITPQGNVFTRKLKLLSDVIKLRKILIRLKPDLVLSSEYPFSIAAILTGIKKHSCVLAWEHHHYNWLEKNSFWETLFRLAYPRLHGIVTLNQTEAGFFAKHGNTFVIPNFVLPGAYSRGSQRTHTILSVGWLIPRKGIDLLLGIAKLVLNRFPGWQWKLIGDGPMREDVLRFKSEDPAGQRLLWQLPSGTDIMKEYEEASIFALTSRFEAFPMVLLEAMSAGLPCVSFNCPTGPADIITHREDGILVEEGRSDIFAEELSVLIENPGRRIVMGERANLNMERYSGDNTFPLWEDLFEKIKK